MFYERVFNVCGTVVALFVIMFVIFLSVGMIHLMYYYPVARETAYNFCFEQGYEYAESFDTLPLSTEPLGIKCNYVSFDKRRIEVETKEPIPVVIG